MATIYLIGGAPRVGKSVAAKALAEKTGFQLISTDDLDTFPCPGFSGTSSENTLSPDERVKLQEVSAQSLEPELDRRIHEAMEHHQNLIMEGVHFLPSHVKQLIKKYGAEKIHAIFLGSKNLTRIIDGMDKNTNPNDWLQKASGVVRRQVGEFVIASSQRIHERAERDRLPYYERTDDFNQDIKNIIESLTGPRGLDSKT